MKITRAELLAKVKEQAADLLTQDKSVDFDLGEDTTRSYVGDLIAKVQESAGLDGLGGMFRLTAEDLCNEMLTLSYPSVTEASAVVEGIGDLEEVVSEMAEDALGLHNLLKRTGFPDLLQAQLNVAESTASPEEASTEETETGETPKEEVTETTDGGQTEEPEATPTETGETPKEEVTETTGEATETVESGGQETQTEETQTEEVTESTNEGQTEEPEATPTEAAKAEKEEVAEAAGNAAFRIVPPSDEVDNTPWGDVDKSAIKARLRSVMESGRSVARAVKEVYGIVGNVDEPSTWKFPHHIVRENGDIVLNPGGLASAVSYLGRYQGSRAEKREAARHFSRHYGQMDREAPATIASVAESIAGVQMVSVEIMDEHGNSTGIDQAEPSMMVQMQVAEATANILQDAGLLSIKEPSMLGIDTDQLAAMMTNLQGFGAALMGEQPETKVTESTANVGNEALKAELELYKRKIDALSSLMDGSPISGVAESIINASDLNKVEALQSVTESIGVKRLITSHKVRRGVHEDKGHETVEESDDGLSKLDLLTREPEDKKPAQSATKKRLVRFV